MKRASLLTAAFRHSLNILQPLFARLPATSEDASGEILTYSLDYYSDENMDDLFHLLSLSRRDFCVQFTCQHFDRSQRLWSPDYCQVREVVVVRQGRVAFFPDTFPLYADGFDFPERAIVGFMIAHPTVEELLFESYATWQSYAETFCGRAEANETRLTPLYDEYE